MTPAQPGPPARTGRLPALLRRLTLSQVMRDTSLVATGQALFKGSLYLASIGLARALSAEDFATFGYFSVTSRFLSIFFAGGLAIAATKAFADAAADAGEKGETAAVAILLAAAALLATLLSPLYLPLLSEQSVRLEGGWLLAGAAAQGAYVVALAAMFGASAFRRLLMPLGIGSVTLLAGALVSTFSGDIGPALAGYVLSFLIPAVLFARQVRKLGLLKMERPSRPVLRKVAMTALPALGIGIIGTGVIWLVTRVLLENAASTAEFNKFVIGMQWFVLVLFLPNALGNALFPRFLHGAREGRMDVRLAGAVAASAFAAIGVLALLATVLTPLLSALYGYEFSRAFVIAVLAAAALAGPANMLSYPVIAAFGVGRWLLVILVLLVANVVLLALVEPATALQAALIMCAGNAAVLVIAVLMLARAGKAAKG